jgi:uncharacterized protein (DUF302 family)
METDTPYRAVRVTHDSTHTFVDTRARFEERVPVFDNDVSITLVIEGATWSEVAAAVNQRVGPHGLAAYARLDQGALLSLSGEPLDATLYIVGNAVIAREITSHDPRAALYAPFRVAIYRDAAGVHVAYDKPSTVFGSLGSADIDAIAAELDDQIHGAAQAACDP